MSGPVHLSMQERLLNGMEKREKVTSWSFFKARILSWCCKRGAWTKLGSWHSNRFSLVGNLPTCQRSSHNVVKMWIILGSSTARAQSLLRLKSYFADGLRIGVAGTVDQKKIQVAPCFFPLNMRLPKSIILNATFALYTGV